MGSRYGGLKQLDPVGPDGEVILDYSVRDAVRAGFDKIVFVIRRDFERQFREEVISRFEKSVHVDVAFQELGDLPDGFVPPPDREKPWGTAHAILAARSAVSGPSLVVNADDFYGPEAYAEMSRYFDAAEPGKTCAMVAYSLANTLSAHGTVSRGVCSVAGDGSLISVEEYSGIHRGADGVIRGKDSAGELRDLNASTPVSMNFWGFPDSIFPALQAQFSDFLKTSGNLPKSEFYIPTAVQHLVDHSGWRVKILRSEAKWLGVTYREDREHVAAELAAMSC